METLRPVSPSENSLLQILGKYLCSPIFIRDLNFIMKCLLLPFCVIFRSIVKPKLTFKFFDLTGFASFLSFFLPSYCSFINSSFVLFFKGNWSFSPILPLYPWSLAPTPHTLPTTTFTFSFSHKPTLNTSSPSLMLSACLLSHCAPPLSTLHTVSAMQHALQPVTAGWGLGLQKEALLCFLHALTLLIEQASSTTTTTPVSWLSFFKI